MGDISTENTTVHVGTSDRPKSKTPKLSNVLTYSPDHIIGHSNAFRQLLPEALEQYKSALKTSTSHKDQIKAQTEILLNLVGTAQDASDVLSWLDDPNEDVAVGGADVLGGCITPGSERESLKTPFIEKLVAQEDSGKGLHVIQSGINAIAMHAPEYIPDVIMTLSTGEMTEKNEKVLTYIANAISYRELLNILEHTSTSASHDAGKIDSLRNIKNYLQPESAAGKVINTMVDFYDQFDITGYGVNKEVNRPEAQFLRELVPDPSTKIIDIGCGTGRLLESLHDMGYSQLSGCDIVPKHILDIRARLPGIDVQTADWHNLPYENESFHVAYCLGRTILHNKTTDEYLAFFKEMHRILDAKGILALDIGDREQGTYAEHVAEFAESMEKKGITNYHRGTVADSPDEQVFSNRFIPLSTQMDALAFLTGFRLVKSEAKAIEGWGNNKNVYYIFEKIDGFDSGTQDPQKVYEAYRLLAPESATLPPTLDD